jgi:hypothetical protein
VSKIEVDHITREKLPHTPGKRVPARPNQEMEVTGKEAPGINNEIPLQALVPQSA